MPCQLVHASRNADGMRFGQLLGPLVQHDGRQQVAGHLELRAAFREALELSEEDPRVGPDGRGKVEPCVQLRALHERARGACVDRMPHAEVVLRQPEEEEATDVHTRGNATRACCSLDLLAVADTALR